MDIRDLAEGPWSELALYTLTDAQITQLLESKAVQASRGWFPARFRFPEHAHEHPQMLLVTRGKLTHISQGISYTQTPNDLLIVPASLRHHALVGEEELEFILLTKDMN